MASEIDRRKTPHAPCDRIKQLESMFEQHIAEHTKFERSLTENTQLTQQIADSTKELVELVKGVKGIRSLIVWLAPAAAMILSILAYFKGVK